MAGRLGASRGSGERLDMARMLAAQAELPAEAAIRDAIGRGSSPDMLGVLFGDGTSGRTARALTPPIVSRCVATTGQPSSGCARAARPSRP